MSDALDRLFADLPDRLTVDQLVELLGLSDRQVAYRWLRDGNVPAIKIGRSWLILRDDIKDHLRSHYNTKLPRATDGAPPDTEES